MLGKLFGTGASEIISVVGKVADEMIHTEEEKQAFKERVEERIAETNRAQIEVNKQEAQHRSIFVAGWRPAIGWLCATAMAVRFLITPLAAPFGYDIPEINWEELSVVLLGILGLGGMRTYEKKKGVAK